MDVNPAATPQAACVGADLALMAGMTPANAATILPKMEGGMAGPCSSCVLQNQAAGVAGIAAACTEQTGLRTLPSHGHMHGRTDTCICRFCPCCCSCTTSCAACAISSMRWGRPRFDGWHDSSKRRNNPPQDGRRHGRPMQQLCPSEPGGWCGRHRSGVH